MKAAVFVAPGQPLEIRTLPDPEPGPAEMVLAVRASGICGSDLHLSEIGDRAGGMTPLPAGTAMGHEFAGEVVAVGRGVAGRFRPAIASPRCHSSAAVPAWPA